jgi:hypothetical protein
MVLRFKVIQLIVSNQINQINDIVEGSIVILLHP